MLRFTIVDQELYQVFSPEPFYMRQVTNNDILRFQRLNMLMKSKQAWTIYISFAFNDVCDKVNTAVLVWRRYKFPSAVRILYNSPLVLALSPTSRRLIDTFSIMLNLQALNKNCIIFMKSQNLNSESKWRSSDGKSESIRGFGESMIEFA